MDYWNPSSNLLQSGCAHHHWVEYLGSQIRLSIILFSFPLLLTSVGIIQIRGIGNMLLSINLSLRRCGLNDVSLGLRCCSWRCRSSWWRTRKGVIWVGCCSNTSKTTTRMAMHMFMCGLASIRSTSSDLRCGMWHILRRIGMTIIHLGIPYRMRRIRRISSIAKVTIQITYKWVSMWMAMSDRSENTIHWDAPRSHLRWPIYTRGMLLLLVVCVHHIFSLPRKLRRVRWYCNQSRRMVVDRLANPKGRPTLRASRGRPACEWTKGRESERNSTRTIYSFRTWGAPDWRSIGLTTYYSYSYREGTHDEKG